MNPLESWLTRSFVSSSSSTVGRSSRAARWAGPPLDPLQQQESYTPGQKGPRIASPVPGVEKDRRVSREEGANPPTERSLVVA